MTASPAVSEVSSETARRAQSPTVRSRDAAVWIGLFALVFVPIVAQAVEAALHFSGSAIDGPFQLYNALRRIAAGMRPGVDFQFFHGVGIPYVHYWLFRLFGGQFHDAELSRQLVSAIVFPASLLLLYRAFGGTWVRSICLTTVTLCVAEVFKFAALLQAVNSMIGLRSSLPTLLPAVLYLATSRRLRVAAGGATLGLALFVSTEQGLAATVAFIVVSVIVVIRSGDRLVECAEAAATVALGAMVLFALLFSVGGVSGALGAFRYNFRLVPMDQYWFFGAPPNPFVSSWAALPRMAIAIPPIGLALVLGTAAVVVYLARVWRGVPVLHGRRDRAFAMLAVYGLVSCVSLLGVFVPVYALPCWRVLIALGLLEALALADTRKAARSGVAWLGLPRPFGAASLAVVGLSIVVRPQTIGDWLFRVPHVVVAHVVHRARFEVSGIWPTTLLTDAAVVARVETAHGSTKPVIWSTYAGWMEARAGVFHPSFDYIIHALGPENRQLYVDDFRRVRPQLVQTIDPRYTPYEPWIENANWDFYHALLTSYAVTARTAWSFLWEPRADTGLVQQAITSFDVPVGASAVRLPQAPAVGGLPVTLLEVQIDYEAKNPWGRVPVVGAMPRYLVGLEGALSKTPVSLDPYTTSSRFPLVVAPGQAPVLHFQAFSLLPGARLLVHRVRVTTIAVPPRNVVWLHALTTRLAP